MVEGRFKVIYGGGVAGGKTARLARGKTPWSCRICIADTGVATTALVKVRSNAEEDARGQISGGHDVWACAMCMARGRFTPATA